MKTLLSARSRLYRGLLRPVLYGPLAVLLLGTPTYGQDKTTEIDDIFSWATPETPGCAVAVSRHGEVVVNRAYGLADLATAPVADSAGANASHARTWRSAPGERVISAGAASSRR